MWWKLEKEPKRVLLVAGLWEMLVKVSNNDRLCRRRRRVCPKNPYSHFINTTYSLLKDHFRYRTTNSWCFHFQNDFRYFFIHRNYERFQFQLSRLKIVCVCIILSSRDKIMRATWSWYRNDANACTCAKTHQGIGNELFISDAVGFLKRIHYFSTQHMADLFFGNCENVGGRRMRSLLVGEKDRQVNIVCVWVFFRSSGFQTSFGIQLDIQLKIYTLPTWTTFIHFF